MSGLLLLTTNACVSADGNNAEASETKEVVHAAPQKENDERRPVNYSNELARELIEKLSADGTLSDEEFLQAVEMDEQGNNDVYTQMLDIVRSANSKNRIVEAIDEKQQELKTKYRYLRQLHRSLISVPTDRIPAALSERVSRLDNNIKKTMQELDSLSRLNR
ncbi:MAG: hypothetical protein NC402_07220 [Prevotella sp.]|nr:hypothetical protein [Prevotella sp.]MCM1074333.1 hypothetical protein [Ruminococcus sp.]